VLFPLTLSSCKFHPSIARAQKIIRQVADLSTSSKRTGLNSRVSHASFFEGGLDAAPERVTPPRLSQQMPPAATPLQFLTHRLRHGRAPSPAACRPQAGESAAPGRSSSLRLARATVAHPHLRRECGTRNSKSNSKPKNQSTSASTAAVVSSGIAMRQSHPCGIPRIASRGRVGHPPATVGLLSNLVFAEGQALGNEVDSGLNGKCK
jgi:hypothetical protein